MAEGLQDSDIRAALRGGGRTEGVFVVERQDGAECSFVVYVRPSWKRGFFILRTYRNRADREYRDLRLLLQHVRQQYGFDGPITIHRARHPDLVRFRNLATCDGPPAAPADKPAPRSRRTRLPEPSDAALALVSEPAEPRIDTAP